MIQVLALSIVLALLSLATVAPAVNAQDISADQLSTPWTAQIDRAAPWSEYPRPQLQRDGWINLNGAWDYAVRPQEMTTPPETFDGKILVPFPIESHLSGVQRRVRANERLWYRRSFAAPQLSNREHLLLHFGAVDWQAEIILNGKQVGRHEGGYDPFTFDITAVLKSGNTQELLVAVWDPTDEGPQPRGKQVSKPNRIWYTAVTGIWQTVWLEVVPATYIVSTRNTPDLNQRRLIITANIENAEPGDALRVSAWDDDHRVAERLVTGRTVVLPFKNAKLWTPVNPFLYQLHLAVVRRGKVLDEVESYFAMREISKARDAFGIQRILLNNKPVFQYGPLDQGWWPDGLYTAPTDEAMRRDLETVKAMGFNMIRKHVKVEPARWYYYCDRLGLLVWQDMPSGDLGNHWDIRPGILGAATDRARSEMSERIYKIEWKAIIDANYNFPCIVVWIPFNEGWGQFKTDEIVLWTRKYDPTRLIDGASGGNFTDSGDIIDLHNYPDPVMPRPELFGRKQAMVLGEFGGLGLPIVGHLWQEQKSWGYREYGNAAELEQHYAELIRKLRPFIWRGLSAAVYTQLTDVEGEVNGLMTYDRRVTKIPVTKLAELHQELIGATNRRFTVRTRHRISPQVELQEPLRN